MKKIILFVSTVLFASSLWSQALDYLWAENVSCSNSEFGTDVAADRLGNVYAVGNFSCSSVSFGGYTLTNSGNVAMYLVKYDGNGNVVWARTAGGGGDTNPWAVAVDGAGNVLVAGTFSGTMTVGTGSLVSTPGGTDIFLLKYDAGGNNLWAQSAGGNKDDNAWSIATDASGNIFVAGDFHSNTFLFDTVRVTGGIPNGKMYVVKYNGNGHALWARTSVGSNNSVAYGVTADAGGNVFVTGAFASPVIVFNNSVLKNNGVSNVFLAKYDGNGNELWGRASRCTGIANANSVAVDENGNSYITGQFTLSGASFENINLASAGRRDIFIAKYNTAGALQWAKSAGGNDGDNSFSVCSDKQGSIYIAGYFKSSSVTFGSVVLTNPALGVPDIFIAKYDVNGNASDAAKGSGNDDDEAYSIACDGSGNIFMTGFFLSSELTCNAITLTNSGTAGTSDMVVAKLGTARLENSVKVEKSSNTVTGVKLYPNPAQGQFTISFNEQLSTVSRQLSVYDATGRKVYEKNVVSGRLEVICPNLSPGVYFVRVTAGEKSYTCQLIIQ